MDFDPRQLPSPYYRLATRAVVLDDQQRLLVMENGDGDVELPGGGWEFHESYQDCLRREIREELGVEPTEIGGFIGMYHGRGTRQIMYARVAFRVALASYDFRLDEMKRAWFVTKDELMQLDLQPAAEQGILEYINTIWSKQ